MLRPSAAFFTPGARATPARRWRAALVPRRPRSHHEAMRPWSRTLVVTLLATAWVSLFWFRPPRSWPPALGLARRTVLDTAGAWTGLPGTWAWVLVSLLLGGLVPAVVLWLVARRGPPSLLGAGTRAGWRLTGLAYLGAFPFLLWLAARPSFRDYYVPMLQGGLAGPALRFVLVITADDDAVLMRCDKELGCPDLPAR